MLEDIVQERCFRQRARGWKGKKHAVVVDLASSPPIDKKLLGRDIVRVSAEDLAAGTTNLKPGSVAIMFVVNTRAPIQAVVKEAERALKVNSFLVVGDVRK